jgi:hypothetical protein
MSGRLPPRPSPRSLREPSLAPAVFRRQRFWMKLAAYRPLFILAGIWIVLLAIALLAYDQLLHTTRDSQPAAPPSPPEEVYPHERLQGNSEAAPTAPSAESAAPTSGEGATSPQQGEAPLADQSATPTGGISGKALAALVGTCALGSWLLTQQFKNPPRPRRQARPAKSVARKRRQPLPRAHVSPRPLPPAPAAVAPKRLAPYDPTQPLVPPRRVHPKGPSPASPPPPRRSPAPPAAEVTVVADEFEHPLDWPTDSLVNAADVRQRRSLSSYL